MIKSTIKFIVVAIVILGLVATYVLSGFNPSRNNVPRQEGPTSAPYAEGPTTPPPR